MKRAFTLLIIILVLLCLASCGKIPENIAPAETQTAENTAPSQKENSGDIADILNEYVKKYSATATWQDAYVDQKFLLYNGDSLIYLFAIKGAIQSDVISLSAIERYEETNLGNVSQITIYNRTTTAVSIILSASDAASLISIL